MNSEFKNNQLRIAHVEVLYIICCGGPGHWSPAEMANDNIIENNWMFSTVYLIININKYNTDSNAPSCRSSVMS